MFTIGALDIGIRTRGAGTPPVPAAPVSSSAPAITGSPIVGGSLSCSTGGWTGFPAPTFTYQWIWADTSANISGATSSTYTPVSGDLGHTLKCAVTATNSQGSATANSNTTAAVASGSGVSPVFTTNFLALSSLPTGVSFSRATTGTYFDASGVLQTAAIDAPRFDHAWNGSAWVAVGPLIEGQRTNLLLQSVSLADAAWGTTASVKSSDATVAPDGSTAFKLVADTSSSSHYIYTATQITITGGGTYTYTKFAKKGTSNYPYINVQNGGSYITGVFDLSGTTDTVASQTATGTGSSVASTKQIYIGNGWFRCQITGIVAVGVTSVYVVLGVAKAATGNTLDPTGAVTYIGAGTEAVYMFLPGSELGSFATSAIPTTTAAVTRSADIVQANIALGTAATIIAEADFQTLAGNPILFGLQGNTNIGANGGSGGAVAFVNDPGGAVFINTANAGAWSTGARVGFAYDATGSSLCIDGGTPATGTATPGSASAPQALGANTGGAIPMNGHYRSIAIYSSRLSDTDLQAKSVVGASF